MSEATNNKVIGKINAIKSNVEAFVADVKVGDLKASINSLVRDAQKDLKGLVDKDIEAVRQRLQKEKADFEAKARKFLDAQKKELATLQEKLDTLVKATAKLKKSRAAAAAKAAGPATRKKATKKAPAPAPHKAPVRKAGSASRATAKKATRKQS
jgi:hypothetical protein